MAKRLVKLLQGRSKRDTSDLIRAHELHIPSIIIVGADATDVVNERILTYRKCEAKASIDICHTDDNDLTLRSCGAAILALLKEGSTEAVEQHCTKRSIASTATCSVKGVIGGYLLSTLTDISVVGSNQAGASKLFDNEAGTVCKGPGVCFLSPTPAKSFICSEQEYRTHALKNVIVESEPERINVEFNIGALKTHDMTNFEIAIGNVIGPRHVAKLSTIRETYQIISIIWWTFFMAVLVVRCVSKTRLVRRWAIKKKKPLPNPL